MEGRKLQNKWILGLWLPQCHSYDIHFWLDWQNLFFWSLHDPWLAAFALIFFCNMIMIPRKKIYFQIQLLTTPVYQLLASAGNPQFPVFTQQQPLWIFGCNKKNKQCRWSYKVPAMSFDIDWKSSAMLFNKKHRRENKETQQLSNTSLRSQMESLFVWLPVKWRAVASKRTSPLPRRLDFLSGVSSSAHNGFREYASCFWGQDAVSLLDPPLFSSSPNWARIGFGLLSSSQRKKSLRHNLQLLTKLANPGFPGDKTSEFDFTALDLN